MASTEEEVVLPSTSTAVSDTKVAAAAQSAVPTSSPPAGSINAGFTPLVTVVGFHHARGPEVESWFGVDEGFDPAVEYGWGLLSFMALSDGAHA